MRVARVIVVATVMLVMGCTNLPTTTSAYQQDSEKISEVNATARERGVKVIWIHPPQKKIDAAVAVQRPKNLAR